jgi:Uma2 family endonuclease
MGFPEVKEMPRMTADQFMDWDGGGLLDKLELVNGEVRAMSPASGTHSLIQANLSYLLGAHLRASKLPCRVGTEAPVQPNLYANDNVRAPDLAVTCAPPTTSKLFPAPVLVVEVLSPGNQKETWETVYALSTIPELAEVAVIDSERIAFWVLRRDANGHWPRERGEPVTDASAPLRLDSIGASFALSEVYMGTHLV